MKTDLTTTSHPYQASKPLSALPSKLKAGPDLKAPVGKPLPDPDFKLDLSSLRPAVPEVPAPEKPVSEAGPEVVKAVAEEVRTRPAMPVDVRDGSIKKPSIIFIKGLDVFSSPSTSEGGYAGLGRMAEAVEGSRLYGWDQKEEIMKEIRKVHPDFPVVVVGHSLGGDTAIEVANSLDSLEHKFRPIDLLVTIDAVGFGNDIIPQNVKEHLNVFGENDLLLNDGPHVARRHEKTKLSNILSPKDHTELDDDKEIQFEIMNRIQKRLDGLA